MKQMQKKERTNTPEENIRLVRQVFEALHTGDTSKVNEFISPQYFNHESQIDPIRSLIFVDRKSLQTR
jgi:hypothetical protein